MDQVVIVGGGMAGLATAYQLHQSGIPFVLLEAGPREGGVVLSEEVEGGFVVDAGPDALLVQKPDGIRLCEELGLGSRLVPTKLPRLAFIQRAGILHPLPAASVLGIPTEIGPFLRTRLFSWAGKLRMGTERFVPPRRAEGDESIGAFMRRRFGREAVDYLAEPLLAGIHAGDVDRLSISALFPRLVEAERTHGSLLKAFRRRPAQTPGPRAGAGSPAAAASPPGSPGADNGGAFRSLPGGLSELVRALVRALPAGSIKLNTPVTDVRLNQSGPPAGEAPFVVTTRAGDSIPAAALVVATPAHATAGILRGADAALADLCGQIPYASTGTVALVYRRDAVSHPLNGSGFVVPRVERTGILAASWLSSKWPNRAPADRVLMRAFVGGGRDPHALDRSDEELVRLSTDALGTLLGIAGPPLFTRVYRWTRASAQHEVGHLDRIRAIEQALARHPGLFITGSGFRGVGIPDCVADGRATGRQVTTWLQHV